MVAADPSARTDQATERVEEEGTIQFKRTALGLVEERKDEASFDMFGDAALPATSPGAGRRRATAAQLEGDEEATNWDDGEGYYMARPGEMIDSKYKVLGVVGKGVFSSVLRATLTSDGTNVAVKMIRNNETMKKAAIREVEILRDLQGRDPDDRCHCVRLLDTTQHRNHTALVFESMAMNLRQALRKYGNDVGINIMAVQSYGRQLFGALRHLRRAGVVHADIKPDNVLVSENNSTVKLCDFGSGFKQDEDPMSSDPAPYLVSRFYRAPEIILGLKYDERIDLWSVSTCLYELYTGKVMFPGKDNNMMLAKMMDMKGRFPVRMLKNHVRVYRDLLLLEPHFQEVQGTYKFQQRTYVANNNNNNGSSSASSAEARLNLVDIIKPKTSIAAQFMAKKAGADDVRSVQNLADLLELCCSLNPENRPSVSSDTVRKHPFFLLAS